MTALRSGLVLTFCSTLAAAAPTQPPRFTGATSRDTSSSTSSQTARGDIVRLRTGGIVRGTIDEKFPGEYVIITTPLGIARRFEWKEVAYAGPAPADVNATAGEASRSSEPAASKGAKPPTPSTTKPERREEYKNGTATSTRSASKRGPSSVSREHEEQAYDEIATVIATADEPGSEHGHSGIGSMQSRSLVTDGNESQWSTTSSRDPVDAPRGQRSGSKGTVSTPALVVGSVGIALLGVGVVSGLQWTNREGQLAALCGKDGSCSDSRPRELTIEEENQAITLNRDRKTYRGLALASSGLGVAALVTGTVLLLTSRADTETSSSARLLVPLSEGADRGGVSLRLKF